MNKEEIALRRLLKIFNEPDRISLKQKIIRAILFLLGSILLLTAYFLIPEGLVIGKIAIVIAAFGGIFMYSWSYYSISLNTNKYLKKYIKNADIEAKLNEINT